MSTPTEISVKSRVLLLRKRKLFKIGLNSAYRLNNGWIAHRRAPDNGWRGYAYWHIYLSLADYEAKKFFAGGYHTLERAIETALRKQAGEFNDEPINAALI